MSTACKEADAAALAAFPELANLITLREAGWSWLPPVGGTHAIDGFYMWPDGSVDAIRVRSGTDAIGIRTAPHDRTALVWELAGTLSDVVAGLLSLPTPGDAGAPQLIRGAAPALWTP